jgi:hypothetical protein
VHFPGFKDKRAGPISIIRKKRGTRKKQKGIKKNERKMGKKGKKRTGVKKVPDSYFLRITGKRKKLLSFF